MKSSLKTALLAGLMVAGSAMAGHAEGMLTDMHGMTLYTFDKDADGMSACYGDCAAKWPPYLVMEGETMGGEWGTVDRTDGTKQWTFSGQPVYLYIGDTAEGDTAGDGLGGVWHMIKK